MRGCGSGMRLSWSGWLGCEGTGERCTKDAFWGSHWPDYAQNLRLMSDCGPDLNSVFRLNWFRLERDTGKNCFRAEQGPRVIKCTAASRCTAERSPRSVQHSLAMQQIAPPMDYGLFESQHSETQSCCPAVTHWVRLNVWYMYKINWLYCIDFKVVLQSPSTSQLPSTTVANTTDMTTPGTSQTVQQ